MKTLRLCWLGVPAKDYEAMLRLLRDVMGLHVEFEEPTTTELSLPSGDRVQVFAPGDPYFEFFQEHSSGPVVLFEVDNVQEARADLIAAGIQVIGDIERDRNWEWLHFRGPDNSLYELASRRKKGRCRDDVSARRLADIVIAQRSVIAERSLGQPSAPRLRPTGTLPVALVMAETMPAAGCSGIQ